MILLTNFLKPSFFFLVLSFFIFPQNLFSQFTMDFGNFTLDDLSNKVYKPDPGADAIILSDIGIAKLSYAAGFFVEFERDVRIRIVNSNGFDFADIEVPFSSDDDLVSYRASTFNLRNGEKTETQIPKKNFIREKSNRYKNILRFNFPDVHEGSVIEYSYILRMKGESIYSLVPWIFQKTVPIVRTSLTVVYPEFFTYKTNISGNPLLVAYESASRDQSFAGQSVKALTYRWSANNVPAFNEEPLMKSLNENRTTLTFELASVTYPGSSREEITPTYETLTTKLLERDDFGRAISAGSSLKKNAQEITKGLNDDLSRVKAIHKFLSDKIFWDGTEDYTASQSLRTAYYEEKGNSADINLTLIAMLRSISIKADPVILSTRTNGSINQFSAMVGQFNYVVANVTIDGEQYLIDATDPLRPFNMLPFNCLNGKGRLISKYESRFVDLKNSEKTAKSLRLNLSLSRNGEVTGEFLRRNTGYSAYEIRKLVQLEGEEGYGDMLKFEYMEAGLDNLLLQNIASRDSDVLEKCAIKIENALVKTGEMCILNPYFCFSQKINPFSIPERKFPVDFGCPVNEEYSIILKIPSDYEILEKPEDVKFSLGKGDAEYNFTCSVSENIIVFNSTLQIIKTSFITQEYPSVRDFFASMLLSQSRLIVLKKKI